MGLDVFTLDEFDHILSLGRAVTRSKKTTERGFKEVTVTLQRIIKEMVACRHTQQQDDFEGTV